MRLTRTGGLGDAGDRMARTAQDMAPRGKIRIMVFQGSARNEESCPDQWGKTRSLIQYAISAAPDDVEIDYCDLSVKGDGNVVQLCKGCVNTSGGFHCQWPCSCYEKGDDSLVCVARSSKYVVNIQ